MKIKAVYIIIIHLWAFSLLGSPFVWLLLPEENVSIVLNNDWEEESGESDVEFSDWDKLMTSDPMVLTPIASSMKPRIYSYHFSGTSKHSLDVILPPPEGFLS